MVLFLASSRLHDQLLLKSLREITLLIILQYALTLLMLHLFTVTGQPTVCSIYAVYKNWLNILD